MEIWLDTINFEVIAHASRRGIVSGITTNPSILCKAKNVQETLDQLLDMQPGPVAVQVTSQDAYQMIEEGIHLFNFSERLIVKVPVNHDGLVAIKELCSQKIPVLGTGVLDASQALLAAIQGVAYIAPYYSHMDLPHDTLSTIVSIMKTYQYPTKVLAASVKHLDDIVFCADSSVDAVTIKDDLYSKLMADHEVLESFIRKFVTDWKTSQGNASLKDLLTINVHANN